MQHNLERRHGWAALMPDGNRPKLGDALMLVSRGTAPRYR
jgi:hypothetical protein